MKIGLVIIDPQVDFCTLESDGAALPVAGANEDMQRLGGFITKNKSRLDDIHVTLDSHQLFHIAHPVFWKNPNTGEHPQPYTCITAADTRTKKWVTTRPSLTRYAEMYTQALEDGGRYPLLVWNPHCLIGTPGHCIHTSVRDALRVYCEQVATVNYVTKGSNPLTEHYSAIRAEVDPAVIWSRIDPKTTHTSDPSVAMNVRFLEMVDRCDKVLIAGEALSHCVANTLRDAVTYFKGTAFPKKLVLLKDASSSVGGFEDLGTQFIDEMVSLGMEIATTDTFQF